MSAAERTRPQHALHEHYSFLTPAARRLPRAEFVERVRDVASGLALCMGIIQSSNVSRDAGADSDTPILGVVDTERLMLFAVASARMLAEEASLDIEHMNNAHQEAQ